MTDPSLRSRYPSNVLVVDDDEAVRTALRRAMEAFGHRVSVASDGPEALAALQGSLDLLLVDAVMPAMDGFELVRKIRSIPGFDPLPVIMVTGHDSRDQRLTAVAAGINDFIAKPVDLLELHLRTEAQLKLKAARDEVERQRDGLEREVLRRTAALRLALDELEASNRRERRAHLATIRALVLAAEYKDDDTAAHIERMSAYVEIIAEGMGLPESRVRLLGLAAPLHDVGKIGIPDAVLLKAGPLTDAEWASMRRHPEIGARILEDAEGDILETGRVIALTHHEKWDGSGYPNGLKGQEIPLEGRICAVADVFDALSSDRVYRPALPADEVFRIVEEESGAHFDPDIAAVFLHARDRVLDVRERLDPASVPVSPSR